MSVLQYRGILYRPAAQTILHQLKPLKKGALCTITNGNGVLIGFL